MALVIYRSIPLPPRFARFFLCLPLMPPVDMEKSTGHLAPGAGPSSPMQVRSLLLITYKLASNSISVTFFTTAAAATTAAPAARSN